MKKNNINNKKNEKLINYLLFYYVVNFFNLI